MATTDELNLLIAQATEIAGNQSKLAELLGIPKSHITQMKQGDRPANWRMRGKLRAIAGEDPTRAFIAAMTEDLEQSENADEKKAADGFKAMLAAFPQEEQEKTPAAQSSNGGSSWRKRRDSNPR